jgi:hypothetical protein
MFRYTKDFKMAHSHLKPTAEEKASGVRLLQMQYKLDKFGNEVPYLLHSMDDQINRSLPNSSDVVHRRNNHHRIDDLINDGSSEIHLLLRYDLANEDGATPLVLPHFEQELNTLRIERLSEEAQDLDAGRK